MLKKKKIFPSVQLLLELYKNIILVFSSIWINKLLVNCKTSLQATREKEDDHGLL